MGVHGVGDLVTQIKRVFLLPMIIRKFRCCVFLLSNIKGGMCLGSTLHISFMVDGSWKRIASCMRFRK